MLAEMLRFIFAAAMLMPLIFIFFMPALLYFRQYKADIFFIAAAAMPCRRRYFGWRRHALMRYFAAIISPPAAFAP